jgi:hypothetical protein
MGLPDDCRELILLRRFRDTYMQETATRRSEVSEYYRVAPAVVRAILRRQDSGTVLRMLWKDFIAPAVVAIENEDRRGAHDGYARMMRFVTGRYVPLSSAPLFKW